VNETDMASLRAAYQFMDNSNLRALMPITDKRRARFFEILSAARSRGDTGRRRDFTSAA
jgi:hypothetical protein